MISTGIHCYKGGSGKSTTALGLAAETARSGKKVLLIDGDFGIPAQAITLKAAASQTGVDIGLADFYIGRASLQKIIRNPNIAKLAREFQDADLQGLERLFVIPPGREALIENKDDIDFTERIGALFSQAGSAGFDEIFLDCRGGSHRYSIETMLAVDRPIVVGNDQEVEVIGMVNTMESYRRHALIGLFGNNQVRLVQFFEKMAHSCALTKINKLPPNQQQPLIRALQESFRLSTSKEREDHEEIKVRNVLHRAIRQMYQVNHSEEFTDQQENDFMYRAIKLLPRSTGEYLKFAESVARHEQQKGMRTDYNQVLAVMKDFATNAAGVIITRVRSDAIAVTAFDRVKSLANSEGLDVKYVGFFPQTTDATSFHYFIQPAFTNGTTGNPDELLRKPELHKNLARIDLLKLKRQYDFVYGAKT